MKIQGLLLRANIIFLMIGLIFIMPANDVLATTQTFLNIILNTAENTGYQDAEDTGYLDPTFDEDGIVITPVGNGDDYGHAVAVQDDGKLVVAGHLSIPVRANDFFVMRYNTDGSLDSSFGLDGIVTIDFGLYDQAMIVAIQSDGKIIVASNSQVLDTLHPNRFAIARLNPDGTLDTSFDGDGKRLDEIGSSHDVITELAIQDDGKIIAGGYSGYVNIRPDFAMVRYNPDGSLDTTFGTEGIVITSMGGDYDGSFATLLQPDGKIILMGFSKDSCSVNDCPVLIRYNSDGSLDTTFGVGGIVDEDFGVNAILFDSVLLSDGKIVSSGYGTAGEGIVLMRHNPDGSLDTTFGTDGLVIKNFGDITTEKTEGMALQPDGKLLISGFYGGDVFLLRYNSDGTPDTSFYSDGVLFHSIGDGDDRARYVALQQDGKIVVTGDTYTGADYDIFVARYLSRGNLPPTVDAGSDATINEGSSFNQTGSFTDPDNDMWTGTVDYGFGKQNLILNADKTFDLQYTYTDNGTYNVIVCVEDGASSDCDDLIVTVNNVAPKLGDIIAPTAPVSKNEQPIDVRVDFTDAGTADTHHAVIEWGDGYDCNTNTFPDPGCALSEISGSGTVTGNHTYQEPGVYTVKITVIDNDGGSATAIYEYVVIYDPDNGFVTGGGWIYSNPGSYKLELTLEGKANFGFVSKYKNGATSPTGNTEFQFRAADMNFHSSTYKWLVISGSTAKYKGVGTINGEGEYKFMIWATDGDLKEPDEVDTFRIKIWLEDEGGNEDVIYDNFVDEYSEQAIGGGNIVIHQDN